MLKKRKRGEIDQTIADKPRRSSCVGINCNELVPSNIKLEEKLISYKTRPIDLSTL